MRNFLTFMAIGACLVLAACGFEPVYGVNRNTPVGVEAKLAQVNIAEIPDREGLYLRNNLIDRFYRDGRPTDPQYDLVITPLREEVTKLDVTKTSDATRGELSLDAHMSLVDRRTGSKIIERDIFTSASYNILGSVFATRVTEDNARQNAIADLARQVEMQLDLYFKRSQ